MYKSPNPSMSSNKDWSATDFERLGPDALPLTSYQPLGDTGRYDSSYTFWGEGKDRPARSFFRLAWRNMAANKNERTLISGIIPPGSAHIHTVTSVAMASGDEGELVATAGISSSLLADLSVRCAPKSTVSASTFARLPQITRDTIRERIRLRALRLNSVTSAYGPLWKNVYSSGFLDDGWVESYVPQATVALNDVEPEWSRASPLRLARDRRQAQIEIDSLVAIGIGVTAEELCAVYRTQFPVLYGYDRREYLYDSNGRLVPNTVQQVWRKKGEAINEAERTVRNPSGNSYTYELPFVNLDREADMRQAYAHFEKLLKGRS
jgi:hypothetical protein